VQRCEKRIVKTREFQEVSQRGKSPRFERHCSPHKSKGKPQNCRKKKKAKRIGRFNAWGFPGNALTNGLVYEEVRKIVLIFGVTKRSGKEKNFRSTRAGKHKKEHLHRIKR